MEIKTTSEIVHHHFATVEEVKTYGDKKWVALDDHLKIIKEIGRLCVGKPSRYDSEQIEKIRKLCLKQIDTLSNENKNKLFCYKMSCKSERRRDSIYCDKHRPKGNGK